MQDLLYTAEKVVSGALLAVLAATIMIQVVFRFILDLPLAWTEEVSRYTFIWLTMVAAPICIREKANLGMDLLVHGLKKEVANSASLLGYALVGILLLVLLIWGVTILDVVKSQRSPAIGVSMAWIYAAIPTGAALMLIEIAVLVSTTARELAQCIGARRK